MASGDVDTVLSVLTTNQKGAIAEAAIVKEAVRLGIGVFKPVADERCDFIFDLRPRLVRVQCKSAQMLGDVLVARLYSARRARAGLVRRLYSADDIDAFAIYCQGNDRCYWLDAGTWAARSQVYLRLEGTKNNQAEGINWASDHEFAGTLMAQLGAVAQLGERLAGSQ